MVLVNGGYLHCTDKKKFLSERDKKKKKMARVISKTQVSDPGPSWPSCSHLFDLLQMFFYFFVFFICFILDQSKFLLFGKDLKVGCCKIISGSNWNTDLQHLASYLQVLVFSLYFVGIHFFLVSSTAQKGCRTFSKISLLLHVI